MDPRHLVGEQLAHFEFVEQLGAGSQGHIYVATDMKLRRRVAVKVLNVPTDDGAERALDEARAAAAVRHPGIVTVYEWVDVRGEARVDDFVLMSMELLEGCTLRAWLSEHERMDQEDAVTVVLDLANALGAAHAEGVVHRDIKPDNIFVERRGDALRAKVLDFGLAKLASERRASSGTREGSVHGSPPYLAPEQVGGHTDCRTDLYSLGCVFYELVAGFPPFGNDQVSDAELIAKHVRDVPESLEDYGADPDVSAVVDRLLRKQPEDRYQSCDELAHALAEHAHHHRAPPSPFRDDGTPERSMPWFLAHKPRVFWAWGFFVGWLLFGTSLATGVARSYAESPNWSLNYMLVLPLLFAFCAQSVQSANAVMQRLGDQPWRTSMRTMSWQIVVIVAVTVPINVFEWVDRLTNAPPMTEWWVESRVLGLLGTCAQGVTTGAMLAYCIITVMFAWRLNELAAEPSRGSAGHARSIGQESDVAVWSRSSAIVAMLTWLALYLGNVKHIAIARGDDQAALSLTSLFVDYPVWDVGPMHASSLMALAGTATVVGTTVLSAALARRAYRVAAPPVPERVLLPSVPMLVASSGLAIAGMVLYQLGLVVAIGSGVYLGLRLRSSRIS